MAITDPGYHAGGDVRIWKVHHGRRDDQGPRLWAAARGAVIDARKIRVAAMERLPMRNTKWALARSPLIERNRGSDAEQIGKAQDTGHLRARIMHDANFVCRACRHRIVTPDQDFDPFGNWKCRGNLSQLKQTVDSDRMEGLG